MRINEEIDYGTDRYRVRGKITKRVKENGIDSWTVYLHPLPMR